MVPNQTLRGNVHAAHSLFILGIGTGTNRQKSKPHIGPKYNKSRWTSQLGFQRSGSKQSTVLWIHHVV